MRIKKILLQLFFVFISVMTGCSSASEKADNNKYIPCVSLKMCEIYIIKDMPILHGNRTAVEVVNDLRSSGKCMDARVGDEAHCIIIYNKNLLEKEYNSTVENLEEYIQQSSLPVKVNYDCNEVIYYVDKTTEITDFYMLVAIGPLCFNMQLLSGIKCEDAELSLKIIYEPTGEEMFNMSVDGESVITMDVDSQGNVSFAGTELTEEEFRRKLNEM